MSFMEGQMMISELRKKLDKKEISAEELCRDYLKKIEKYDRTINSFITICSEKAILQAKMAQKKIDKGNADMLCGIPIAIKDNICTAGLRTTCASKMMEDFVPPYNAMVVEKLENAGSVILGKTNMDEFAMGSTGQNSYFGPVKNPYNENCVSGGSSSGSAAAVSADFCVAALGSDTGGSVRQPAAFCGDFAIKPTYGVVSRFGLVAFASSFDQIGIISKCAEDAGIVLNCIAGKDDRDATCVKKEYSDFCQNIGKSIKGTKIGIVKEFFCEDISEEIRNCIYKVVEYYKDCGCEIVQVSMPTISYAVPAYYLISSAEAASNLSRFDGIKYGYRNDEGENFAELLKKTRSKGFGDEVKRRIMIGNYALSSGYYDEYYNKALNIKRKLISEYKEIFKIVDLLLTPTYPTVAFKSEQSNYSLAETYMADICTIGANLTGLPAVNVPCGCGEDKLPIGFSLTGRKFCEAELIGVAECFEKNYNKFSTNF